MRDYGERQFALSARQKDGFSLRDHLENGWRQTGIKPEELDIEPLQHCIIYLWDWFIEISRGRTSNGFGPNAIGFVEIDAWQRVTGRRLDPWEIDAMLVLDAAYLASVPVEKPEA